MEESLVHISKSGSIKYINRSLWSLINYQMGSKEMSKNDMDANNAFENTIRLMNTRKIAFVSRIDILASAMFSRHCCGIQFMCMDEENRCLRIWGRKWGSESLCRCVVTAPRFMLLGLLQCQHRHAPIESYAPRVLSFVIPQTLFQVLGQREIGKCHGYTLLSLVN